MLKHARVQLYIQYMYVLTRPFIKCCLHTIVVGLINYNVYLQSCVRVYISAHMCSPLSQGYTDEPIDKILVHVEEGPVVEMDRWHLGVWPNPNVGVIIPYKREHFEALMILLIACTLNLSSRSFLTPPTHTHAHPTHTPTHAPHTHTHTQLPPEQMVDTDAVGDVPLHVINNYFSIGADAHVVLEFHLERGEF